MTGAPVLPASPRLALLSSGPRPEDLTDGTVPVDLGGARCCGLDGLRVLLAELARAHPDLVDPVAERRQPEWNVLFPGTFPDAAPLATLAATCSERRLHAESEQVFRVITAAGAAAAAVAARRPLTVLFRSAGRLDLPTLRAVPHLAERAAMTGADLRVVLADLAAGPAPVAEPGAAESATLRGRLLDALAARLGQPVRAGGAADPARGPVDPPASAERSWLDALDRAGSAAQAVTATLGLMRATFFSTAHDNGVFAAHRLLAELERTTPVDLAEARRALEAADLGDDPGSVGIDPAAVVDADGVRSLAHRYLGTVHVFGMGYRTALHHLEQAAGLGPPAVRARARLLRALLLIKRTGDLPAGFAEVSTGLAALQPEASAVDAVEAAWLHNVRALGHVQRRELGPAMAEERRAVQLVGKLSSTDATHLKVNLVSNISVLREYSGRPDAALDVWRQFSRRSADWGPAFFKHHAYREGGLLVRAGRAGDGTVLLERVHRLAAEAGDHFYGTHVALELGRLLLDADPAAALGWYDSAARSAAEAGDPYLAAVAAVGAALAGPGTVAGDDRQAALRLLAGSTSYPERSATLAAALRSGSDADLAACLPAVGTKLNRPFHTVRLDLPRLG